MRFTALLTHTDNVLTFVLSLLPSSARLATSLCVSRLTVPFVLSISFPVNLLSLFPFYPPPPPPHLSVFSLCLSLSVSPLPRRLSSLCMFRSLCLPLSPPSLPLLPSVFRPLSHATPSLPLSISPLPPPPSPPAFSRYFFFFPLCLIAPSPPAPPPHLCVFRSLSHPYPASVSSGLYLTPPTPRLLNKCLYMFFFLPLFISY